MKIHFGVFNAWMFGAILLASPLTSSAQTLYDVQVRVLADELTLQNDSLRLTFDRNDGRWTGLYYRDPGDNILKTGNRVDAKVGGEWLMESGNPRFVNYSTEVDPSRRHLAVNLTWATDLYTIEVKYALQPRTAEIVRSCRVQWLGSVPAKGIKLEGFVFESPFVIGSEDDCALTVPGPFFPKTFVAPQTPYRQLLNADVTFHSAPDAGFGVLILGNRNEKKHLFTWMNTSGETNHQPFLRGDGVHVRFGNFNHRYYYLKTGMWVSSDQQIIRLSRTPHDGLRGYRAMLDETIPLDKGAHEKVKDMVILEVYPKYYKGGWKEITNKLTYYKGIGFNTLYVMPHWLGGYSPIDPLVVNPAYGSSQELKEMVSHAHTLGMTVLFDMVIHGFHKDSPYIQSHPRMFVHEPDGSIALHPTWKSLTTDWASGFYQDFMVSLVQHDLEKYDIDGYRIDAASYKGPSWDTSVTYPAYLSGTLAPELMAGMLAAMRQKKRETIFLNEVFGPVFYRVFNLSHDNQTEAVQVLIDKIEQGDYTADQYKSHIRQVYEMLPAGANRVFFSRNHDTSWFHRFDAYSPLYFCFEAVHSFFGIPEVFAGDPDHPPYPDAQPEVFSRYRKLFALRKKFPTLVSGEMIFDDVKGSDPNVFCAMRVGDERSMMVLVNMSGKPTSLTVQTGRLLPAQVTALDVFNDQAVAVQVSEKTMALRMKPYQVVVAYGQPR